VGGTLTVNEAFEFDSLNRLTAQEQTPPAGQSITEKRGEYTLNDIGQYEKIVVMTDLSGSTWTDEVVTTTFTYDAAHRVTKIEHTQGSTPTTLAKYEYNYDCRPR